MIAGLENVLPVFGLERDDGLQQRLIFDVVAAGQEVYQDWPARGDIQRWYCYFAFTVVDRHLKFVFFMKAHISSRSPRCQHHDVTRGSRDSTGAEAPNRAYDTVTD